MFEFEIFSRDGRARHGKFVTPHGSFETPVFMPCATKGSVKTLTKKDLDELGCEIYLNNTFHMYLRPGADLIKQKGGLHKFAAWDKPINEFCPKCKSILVETKAGKIKCSSKDCDYKKG